MVSWYIAGCQHRSVHIALDTRRRVAASVNIWSSSTSRTLTRICFPHREWFSFSFPPLAPFPFDTLAVCARGSDTATYPLSLVRSRCRLRGVFSKGPCASTSFPHDETYNNE